MQFNNVNCGYALVDNLVFDSIRAAENYCISQGYDPAWVEADSDDALLKCKQIASTALPCLRHLLDEQRKLFETLCKRSRSEGATLDAAKAKHELGWEVHEEWANHAAGEVSGCYSSMDLLHKRINTYERIMRISPKEIGHQTKG